MFHLNMPGACTALLLASFALWCGAAEAQEALAAGGPYKLVTTDADGALVLSGLKRGAEPESVEAWLWTFYPAQKEADGKLRDATAQEVVLRCTGHSVETLRAEYYLGGEGRSAPAEPDRANKPSMPKEPRPGTPQDLVWRTACDSMARFRSKTYPSLDAIKSEIAKKFAPTVSAAAQ